MGTDRRRRACRVWIFAFIGAYPRYPWLKIFCSPALVLVLVGLRRLVRTLRFLEFPIQFVRSCANLQTAKSCKTAVFRHSCASF